jgi:hypothetical protein
MQEWTPEMRLVPIVAESMHEAIEEAFLGAVEKSEGDAVEAAEIAHAIWEATTTLGVNMIVNSRTAVIRAVDRTIERLIEEGHADGMDGRASLTMLRDAVGDHHEEAAKAAVLDWDSRLVAVEACVGTIPPEVFGWLSALASGRLIDPVGWLRGSIEEVVEA